ncbi:MAG: PhnE/PtxC family ABC transporter permease [Oceanobacter sp.]
MLPAVFPLSRQPSSARHTSFLVLGILFSGLLALLFADIEIYTSEPWTELSRLGQGFILPDFSNPKALTDALLQTLAFALLAVALSAPLGLLLATVFHWRLVRGFCAAIRSVHEVFWGLLFMQVFGLSALTGLLAILVPYTGVFAKVYAETLELQSDQQERSLPRVNALLRWVYTRIPQAWPALTSYTRYRFECALRSSAILGFIGLPTLGFHLETALKQGQYSEAGALIWLFLALIASIQYWLKPKLLPIYLFAALWLLPDTTGSVSASYLWQFISQDIWPSALRNGDMEALWSWLSRMISEQAWPGIVQTLLLTQAALALTLVFVLIFYPFASRTLASAPVSFAGHALLLVMRSTPEMLLAFVFLLLFGPSGLPAVLALALHNGGLISYLVATSGDANTDKNSTDSKNENSCSAGVSLSPVLKYAYQETPRRLPNLLAWLFYRWEVMLRETAIMGILGIATLGFYIDSAFEEIRYDRAFFLLLVAILLNLCVDAVSRRLRRLVIQ